MKKIVRVLVLVLLIAFTFALPTILAWDVPALY